MHRERTTIDGNEAVAAVAYKLSELIAIYPITPSTPMAEASDAWSASDEPNLWGVAPLVQQMQSEAGAAGALHGAILTGALTTTFTASQGLLLMIPNMYKIAGELSPTVFHVAARSLAAQGLSIFGDHSDVMATRATGFALLASGSVQEAHDLAAVAHAATLRARVPFLHFFDGFRTSHEINTVETLADDDLRALIDDDLVRAHRARALNPEHPVIRGTAQNPDVYFQARESVNPYYAATPAIVQRAMDALAARTGRRYRLFDYDGAPDAERVIVTMGSGAETARETARALVAAAEKVGVLTVRLYRPFSAADFLAALPPTTRSVAVLDRTKEPGSAGEPLFLDVVSALAERRTAAVERVIGGRYGLSSKEFTPAMAKAVFDELVFDELAKPDPIPRFTVGIRDDLSGTSLEYDPAFSIEDDETAACVFWGLSSDGTVGANKDSIKIIGESEDTFAQGYFVYDSKKSGSVTVSHLRFGPRPIRAPYLIERAGFVACHQFPLLERFDVLKHAAPGATFLLNSAFGPDEVWERLPVEVQAQVLEKRLRLFVIDAAEVARRSGIGGYVNRIMQTCFFALGSGMPRERAVARIKASIAKTYARRGPAVVEQNLAAVDAALSHLREVDVPLAIVGECARRPAVSPAAPAFVREVLGAIAAGEGDALPVSALPPDGAYPTGTARYEKRGIAAEIPVWDAELCIQCNKCAFVCPHAAIRPKVFDIALLEGAPDGFVSTDARSKEFPGAAYALQVAPDDCTGCGICVEACPVKDKREASRRAIAMAPLAPVRERERRNWEFFVDLPDPQRGAFSHASVKNSQLLCPLFEFSGACAGCGETPYLKLLTQLFGDRMLVANATGCSSIYGGNLPTTPWSTDGDGRGPAWANSLFEDNAEFGLGMRLTLDRQAEYARALVPLFRRELGDALADGLLDADQSTEERIAAQRLRVAALKQRLASSDDPGARDLVSLADVLVRRSVWLVGGDGWAYDIGYGGLDHVLASGRNVNVLVLDTEVYSNTGGQASKSTPRAAVAKFAARGKATAKKDLGLMAMAYGNVYVARIAMGASDQQTLRALLEAEAYDGPSLVIAYSHCIAHGIDMRKGLEQQRLAVQSGIWPLYRFNPRLAAEGQNPLTIDAAEPSVPVARYTEGELRYRLLKQAGEGETDVLLELAEEDARGRWDLYRQMTAFHYPEIRLPPERGHAGHERPDAGHVQPSHGRVVGIGEAAGD